jgi:hypothetical protein
MGLHESKSQWHLQALYELGRGFSMHSVAFILQCLFHAQKVTELMSNIFFIVSSLNYMRI